MKEKLYTIELHDALQAGDECPFCWLERKLEQSAIEFVLGSSYMESDRPSGLLQETYEDDV